MLFYSTAADRNSKRQKALTIRRIILRTSPNSALWRRIYSASLLEIATLSH
jgi:hypothetical protein